MRRPGLKVAAVLVATGILTAWDAVYLVAAVVVGPVNNDFRNYYTAATIGLRYGWARIFDLALQQRVADGLGLAVLPFANPPPLAWLAAPFAVLPFRPALVAWLLMLLAAFGWAWWVAAPGRGLARIAALTAAFGVFPVAFAFVLGQACVLVAAAVGVTWWLAKRGNPVLAGLALTMIVLKPQDALLLPFALLVSGRWRIFASWAVPSALLAAVSLLSLGASGWDDYRHALGILNSLEIGRRYALPVIIGTSPLAQVLQVGLGLAALGIAWRRRASLEAVVLVGVLGSFMATPYLSLQDQVVLVVAVWVCLQRRVWRPIWLVLGLGYVALEFAIPLGGAPLMGLELLLLAACLHDDEDGRPEKDDPERREDAAHHRQHHLQ